MSVKKYFYETCSSVEGRKKKERGKRKRIEKRYKPSYINFFRLLPAL